MLDRCQWAELETVGRSRLDFVSQHATLIMVSSAPHRLVLASVVQHKLLILCITPGLAIGARSFRHAKHPGELNLRLEYLSKPVLQTQPGP